ncbi:hypothetical protein KPZU09_42900 [Klebsiella pneumoniae]|uniref:Uncharacterized protein n=1 Tax=Klebsiella pneumoniae TaxID=573 RepID=A0A919LU48_KLEPN|nr:hypothetical protein KPZU09_42900 [Klebsiella pneumoniae]
MSKAAARGAEAPADDGEHNIQRIACGDAETQSDAAADPVAHGVADQQKKIRARTEQSDKVGQG